MPEARAEPDLLRTDERGLACAMGGFHIDPWRPVPIAVITHAHSDHARAGSGRCYCLAEGAALLRHRLGPGATVVPVPRGERVELGGARVSFHPAGHVLGSAQVRVEPAGGGPVWVASGDYKIHADPTCAGFEGVACDVFITEATFALPAYRWRPPEETIGQIRAWWAGNAAEGRASVLFCYALGKAQRILAELRSHILGETGLPAAEGEAVLVHGGLVPLIEIYRSLGVAMMPTAAVGESPASARSGRGRARSEGGAQGRENDEASSPMGGRLILAPPSAGGSPWMRRFGADEAYQTAFASGWMQLRGIRRRRGYDRGFVLSDHADWDGLLSAIARTGARRVLTTHGYADVLARYLREQGLDAEALRTDYLGESED